MALRGILVMSLALGMAPVLQPKIPRTGVF